MAVKNVFTHSGAFYVFLHGINNIFLLNLHVMDIAQSNPAGFTGNQKMKSMFMVRKKMAGVSIGRIVPYGECFFRLIELTIWTMRDVLLKMPVEFPHVY